jgi:hypothetical protein
LYIKCDKAKRNNRIDECIGIAKNIINLTMKTLDFVQQSNDYLYVAEVRFLK